MYKVKLLYFKPATGKFYTEGEYKTEKESLFDIFAEVRRMQKDGRLPGLVQGAKEFFVYVDVPGQPHEHPALILPE